MPTLQLTTAPSVEAVFANYPDRVREKMQALRALVLEVAESIPDITSLEETLKWGEPSYLAKKGSTLRMDWKAKTPDQYAMYFSCSSLLVPTFRVVFPATFRYEGKRAIVFQLDEELPLAELKACIRTALTYHQVKALPNLGMV